MELNDALATVIGEVARRLLGEPNKRISTRRQLRFGSRGALIVEIDGTRRGCWFDHSAGEGGGERGGNRRAALERVRAERLVSANDPSEPSTSDAAEVCREY